mgnify:CR=1 FL=1
MKNLPDIDIDLYDRTRALMELQHHSASIETNGLRRKHNTGIYVQDIPTDHLNVSTIPYERAEELGYFKLDLLNNSAYAGIDSLTLRNLLFKQEPNWDLLQEREIVQALPHIADHFPLVQGLNPRSVVQLAAVIAIIRPGKRHLANSSWEEIMDEVWKKPTDDSYYFKKSHSIAYALMIIMRLNFLEYQSMQ